MAVRTLNLTTPSKLFTFSGDATTKLLKAPKSLPIGKSFADAGFATKKSVAAKAAVSSGLACLWREIQGLNNWENLVEPLDHILQQEIIRYGEFVNACYLAHELNRKSSRYLNCKYGKKSMLDKVGMLNSGYEVTKYIYATTDINIPMQNQPCFGCWVGYVAVSTDEEVKRLGRRDIMVTFRGTATYQEWVANFMSSLTPARFDPHYPRPDVRVEAGFLSLYTAKGSDNKFGQGSCREQLLSEVSRLLNKYRGEEISITLAGHSMGSSLALLLAYDIAELQLNKDIDSNNEIPITVFSFGGPRVGNLGFKERCDELGLKVLRIVNKNDPITKLPGIFFNDNFRVLGMKMEVPNYSSSCYVHVGVEIAIDFFMMRKPFCVHDLETYISLLKCPKINVVFPEKKDRLNLLDKARGLLLRAQNVNPLIWRDAAMNMMKMFLMYFILCPY